MIVDKKFCMSSYLMYRTVADSNRCFAEGVEPKLYCCEEEKIPVKNSYDLESALRKQMEDLINERGADRVALALSGGIDSAILAKYMPKGSKVYTFQCIVPNVEVTNEVPQAKKYAEECGLNQEVVPVYWEDMEKYTPILMAHKGAPIHSIEVQIYKAALKAKEDGFDTIIFGESSDLNYGGLSDLMSKDWKIGEFIDRYSYVLPYYALKDFELITEPYERYTADGICNVHEFCRGFFLNEAMGSYTNACECAGIKLETPYVHTALACPLDMERIRKGENKYIVREVFGRLYKGREAPAKIPMPRPMNEWFKYWNGPVRQEFWPHCTDGMTGDQKWLVWCLERYLNLLDEKCS